MIVIRLKNLESKTLCCSVCKRRSTIRKEVAEVYFFEKEMSEEQEKA